MQLAAPDPTLPVVLFVAFMEQFVLSPVHCDIIAAQRRAAEMPSQSPVRVMHFSCRAGNINRGIHLEFSTLSVGFRGT